MAVMSMAVGGGDGDGVADTVDATATMPVMSVVVVVAHRDSAMMRAWMVITWLTTYGSEIVCYPV